MIPVSSAWAAVQNDTLLPEMFVKITYTVTEPGLQEEATVTGSSPESFSDVDQMVSVVDKKSEAYTTLDYGCWGLDGSFNYFDGSPVDPGYINTNYSDDGGSVENTIITIDFEKRHDVLIPGMIITWGEAFGGWATDFIVTASNAAGVVAQKTVTGNTEIETTVWLDMVEYSRITIEVLKWSHPYQRTRCLEIHLGVKRVYTKTDLLGYDHSQSVDLLSATLPNNEVTFKLRNDDGRWNPDTPVGNEKYLLEQQELRVEYGMDVNGGVEWIKGGTFWLSEWNTPSNGLEAVFTARHAIEFMGMNYTGIRSGTLYDIAVAAFTEADLPKMDDGSERYVVSDTLKEITTDFTDSNTDYLVSEVLQMIAHAGGCVFYQDRTGLVHIEPWNRSYCGYKIEPSISYTHPEYTINKPLKSVMVEYGSDRQSATVDVSNRGEIQTISNPMLMVETDALRVGNLAKELLQNRKVVSGDFRADLRMDALDNVIVVSKYASNVLGITDVTYSTTGGAFRGTYTGRVVSIDLESVRVYNGEVYVGEVW